MLGLLVTMEVVATIVIDLSEQRLRALDAGGATSLLGNDYRTPVVLQGAPQPRLHPHQPGNGPLAVRAGGGRDAGDDSGVGGAFSVDGLHANGTTALSPCS